MVSVQCGLLGRVENVVLAYYKRGERGKRVVRTHWKPDGRSKNLARSQCERSKDVVRT